LRVFPKSRETIRFLRGTRVFWPPHFKSHARQLLLLLSSAAAHSLPYSAQLWRVARDGERSLLWVWRPCAWCIGAHRSSQNGRRGRGSRGAGERHGRAVLRQRRLVREDERGREGGCASTTPDASRRRTALHHAVRNDHVLFAKMLLSQGASPDAENNVRSDTCSHCGATCPTTRLTAPAERVNAAHDGAVGRDAHPAEEFRAECVLHRPIPLCTGLASQPFQSASELQFPGCSAEALTAFRERSLLLLQLLQPGRRRGRSRQRASRFAPTSSPPHPGSSRGCGRAGRGAGSGSRSCACGCSRGGGGWRGGGGG